MLRLLFDNQFRCAKTFFSIKIANIISNLSICFSGHLQLQLLSMNGTNTCEGSFVSRKCEEKKVSRQKNYGACACLATNRSIWHFVEPDQCEVNAKQTHIEKKEKQQQVFCCKLNESLGTKCCLTITKIRLVM